MMSKISCLLLLALSTSMVFGFAPIQKNNGRKGTVSVAMMTMPPPPPTALEQVVVAQQQPVASTSAIQTGAQAYLAANPVDSSSVSKSLR